MKNKYLLLVLFNIFLLTLAQAQTETVTFPFSFHVFDEDSKLNLSDKSVKVYENGNLVKPRLRIRNSITTQNPFKI